VAGKKGMGLRNLNASRFGWRSFWRRRALKAEDKWILPTVESYATGLASDKPGLTEAESRLIEIGQIARGASMLILAEAARSGFIQKIDGTWDLAPGAKELAKFLTVERGALKVLGLDRRTRPIDDLASRVIAMHKQETNP